MKNKLINILIIIGMFSSIYAYARCYENYSREKPEIKIYTEDDYGCSCGSIQAFISNLKSDPDVVFIHYDPSSNNTPGSIMVIKRGTGCIEYGSFSWCSDKK